MAISERTAQVAVVLGSKSDLEFGMEAMATLEKLGVAGELRILSAHRTPDAAREFATGAAGRGLRAIIAMAGAAAHLPGVLASWTELPVIGVPLPTSDLRGQDALLAIVQMPGGIPVACMAVGTPGARNSAIFAAQILAATDRRVAEAIRVYREDQARRVLADAAEVSKG